MVEENTTIDFSHEVVVLIRSRLTEKVRDYRKQGKSEEQALDQALDGMRVELQNIQRKAFEGSWLLLFSDLLEEKKSER